jgi:hypothetical protein
LKHTIKFLPDFPYKSRVNTPFLSSDYTITIGPTIDLNAYLRDFVSSGSYLSHKLKMVVLSASEQRKVALATKEYLRHLDTHRYRSIREQARRRGVSLATLSRYVEIIRKANESELAIIHTLERGLVPASVAMIGDAANTLRTRIDPNAKPVSNSWLQRFLKRFPSLLVKSTEPLETQRKNAYDPEAIRLWFSEYEGTIKQFNIQRFDVWNFDETGFRIGWLGKTKVVVSRANRKKCVGQKQSYISERKMLICIT